MSNKELLKQLEIEKKRRAENRVSSGAGAAPDAMSQLSSEHRYAWEYELEAYRAQKKKAKWMIAGALCGVLSMILEVGFHWGTIINLIKVFPLK